tara:strand:+ start:780 stop:998 length:219 start_codon:yes stop_codon:yes gene_type:complete
MIPKVHQTKMFIKNELVKNQNENYWGTEENINKENELFDYLLKNKIVNQDFFDEKLKFTNVELLQEILKVLK